MSSLNCSACGSRIDEPESCAFDGDKVLCPVCTYLHTPESDDARSALGEDQALSSTFLEAFTGSDTRVGRKDKPPEGFALGIPKITLGRKRIGPFVLHEELAAQPIGIAYKAWDERTEQWVALRLMRPARTHETLADRFIEEARICASLYHPGIIRCLDVGHAGPLFYLALEYIEGVDLELHLQVESIPDLTTSLTWTIQLCQALAYAHNKGVVHRDLTPSNILLTVTGRPMIIDYGLARALERSAMRMTGSPPLLGTPLFMATEQIVDPSSADQRVDLYALGMLLFRLLTNRYPFDTSGTLSEMLTRKTTQPPMQLCEALPDAPPALDSLIDKLLSAKRQARPASALDVIDALQAIQAALPE